MKAYLISVAATCVLLVLLELTLSEGKTKKFVQGILRLVIVIVLLTPVVGLAKGNFGLENIVSENSTVTATINNDSFGNYIVEKTERTIEKKLNANPSGKCSVKIVYENQIIKNVIIIVKENGINEQGENIFTNEKIIEAVTSAIEIDKDRIIVYGTEN